MLHDRLMARKALPNDGESVRHTVSLTPDVSAVLKKTAEVLGMSESEIIRRAVLKAFKASGWEPGMPIPETQKPPGEGGRGGGLGYSADVAVALAARMLLEIAPQEAFGHGDGPKDVLRQGPSPHVDVMDSGTP